MELRKKITVMEAVELTGFSRPTITKLTREGKLKGMFRVGRYVYYWYDEFAESFANLGKSSAA